MRGTARVKALPLVGLVFVAGVLLLIADGAMRQQADAVELPPIVRWYPVAKATTPEAYMLEFDPNWLNR